MLELINFESSPIKAYIFIFVNNKSSALNFYSDFVYVSSLAHESKV